MRNPDRIPTILTELAHFWTRPENHNLRLAQIIGNLASSAGWNSNDTYYLEDDELLSELQEANSY